MNWVKNKVLDWGINQAKGVLKSIPYAKLANQAIEKGHEFIQKKRGRNMRRFKGRRTQRWGAGGGRRGGTLWSPSLVPPIPWAHVAGAVPSSVARKRQALWPPRQRGRGYVSQRSKQTQARQTKQSPIMAPTPRSALVAVQGKGYNPLGGVQVLPPEYQKFRWSSMY